MKQKNFFSVFVFIVLCPLFGIAQNITDLSVQDDDYMEKAVDNLKKSPFIDDTVFLNPDRIRYDSCCFQIDGKDVFIFSGSFHYFRVPKALWADRFHKMKKAGFNCVDTYIPWNWHERQMPVSLKDQSCLDMTDLEDFLDMAEDFGLYVIVRPGPYICAEWSGGGFPQWIMRKKPLKTSFDVWLQSTDSVFMAWNEHWYDAVCRVVEPHQIIHKAKKSGGVILWQIENEFNRINWFTKETKKDYLVKLTEFVRSKGIEIPIITCWTNESRNVTDGLLNGVLDMVNSYPKWNVEKSFGKLINLQIRTQPGKPLVSGELQGGWLSEIGGALSWNQEGLQPVQTQNITLYALQRGFCALNYYMVVGGTNFDDWGARQITTTYDFAAAIGEDGKINERFRRFKGLSDFIQKHGIQIARSEIVPFSYSSTDPEVEVVLRETADGDRYYFLRTEEHTRSHFGSIQTEDRVFDFSLEPFGSMVYYIPFGAESGEWYPQLPQPKERHLINADTIYLGGSKGVADLLPKQWKKLNKGEYIDDKGIYGRHFIYYRTKVPQGHILEIGRIGKGIVNGTYADTVLVAVDNKLIPMWQENENTAYYKLPGDSTVRKMIDVILLYESKGLHHHTKKIVEDKWNIGPDFVRCEGKDLPLEFAYVEKERGMSLSNGNVKKDFLSKKESANPLMVWHNFSFKLPKSDDTIKIPYHLRLKHSGNGFIYLNGYCIGRCWQAGPQTDYYLPECWLNFGGENRLVISMKPYDGKADIQSAELIPSILTVEK